MAVKPEDLDEDTTFDEGDIVLKTNSSHVTRTIKASNIFSWLWAKVKAKILSSEVTLHALDEAQSYTPVDSTAVNSAINGALTNYTKHKYATIVFTKSSQDVNLGSDSVVSALLSDVPYNQCSVYCTFEDGAQCVPLYTYFDTTNKLHVVFSDNTSGAIRIGVNVFY